MRFLFLVALAAMLGPFPADGQVPPQPLTPPSTAERWDYFVKETFTPLTVAGSAFNAGMSQATKSDPQYGAGAGAYGERFGAAVGGIVSENFFGDFVMASVLHEDTRYRRKGPGHGFWWRVGYAVSRAVVTRTDSGGSTVNWANLIGTGFSAGLANAYFPPASRTWGATAINWASSAAGTGLGSLLPEFLPDFKSWLKRHHL